MYSFFNNREKIQSEGTKADHPPLPLKTSH